jgi:hypothetical protein
MRLYWGIACVQRVITIPTARRASDDRTGSRFKMPSSSTSLRSNGLRIPPMNVVRSTVPVALDLEHAAERANRGSNGFLFRNEIEAFERVRDVSAADAVATLATTLINRRKACARAGPCRA